MLDFVNNVYFSLDYTENDYDTDKDGKKGEINVDDFTIGYKNSKNTFIASNSINEAISSAINNDSGITTKWSKNLWSNIRNRYNDVVSVVGLKELKEITLSEIKSVDNAKLTYLVVHSITVALVGILTASIIFIAIKKGLITDQKWKFISAAVIGLIFIVTLLWAIFNVLNTMGSSRKNLNDKLDSIDPTKTSYRIIKNIDNDEKYFVSEDGKAEFEKLSVDDMRNKKVYYESGYKLAKGETESDLTKYLGGKAAHEELINNIKDVIESYKWMFLLTAFTVVVIIVLSYILASLIKASSEDELSYVKNQQKLVNSGSEDIANSHHSYEYISEEIVLDAEEEHF